MINRLIQWVGTVTLGKDVTMGLMLLRLISDAVKTHEVDGVSKFVYQQLPAAWRDPHGPVTETEFVDMVQAGQVFLSKIQAVFKVA